MSSIVQIDFVGMCVLVRGRWSRIALLNEPSHLHVLSYRQRDKESNATVTTLKILRPCDYRLDGCAPGLLTVLDRERLPDLNVLTGAGPAPAVREDAFRATIALPGGTFETRPPVNPLAEGPWRFGDKDQSFSYSKLTDRSCFTGSALGVVALSGYKKDAKDKKESVKLELEPDADGVIRATVIAVDRDLGTRKLRMNTGFRLTEFQLLYDSIDRFGPIPVYQKEGNPDEATCPHAQLGVVD